MATLNYCTLITPKVLFDNIELLSATPYFNVYKYKRTKGVIFRLPKDLETGIACHVFFEHEINLTNTLKTKTLTLKTQVTFVPVSYGLFCGFEHLEGSVQWYDEDDYASESFMPNYQSDKNVKRVAGLPPKAATGILKYLEEILFKEVTEAETIDQYAVSLGCQVKTLQKMIFIPAPTEHTQPVRNTIHTKAANYRTLQLFETLSNDTVKLLPE